MANVKLQCAHAGCLWSLETTTEELAEKLSAGTGQFQLTVYRGHDTADEFRFLFCPAHTEELTVRLERVPGLKKEG